MRRMLLGLALAASLLPIAAFADQGKKPRAMIVTFTIKDYESWRPVFKAAASERAKDGVGAAKVYRNADSPNDLLVVFEVTSEKSGRTWMSSPQVRAAWEKGGVIGTPGYRFAK
jgi:hypothetical protein